VCAHDPDEPLVTITVDHAHIVTALCSSCQHHAYCARQFAPPCAQCLVGIGRAL
jgi:hypothetical protein